MPKDVPPYLKAVGNPIKLYGLNSVGLQRNGFAPRCVHELKRAYRLFFRSELNVTQAMERARARAAAVPGGGALPRIRRARAAAAWSSERAAEDRRRRRGRRSAITTCASSATSPGAELVGFHETNAERAAKVVAELGVKAFDTLDALLDDVGRGDDRRADAGALTRWRSAAIEAGKHVLIEKPIAATLEEADDLLAAATRSGVDRADRARGAIQPRGARGAAVRRRIRASSRATGSRRSIRAASDVAVVLDLMIHDIDLVLDGRRRQGRGRSRRSGIPVLTPCVDIANARITFDTGAVANITASRVSRDRMPQAAHLPAERISLARPRRRGTASSTG